MTVSKNVLMALLILSYATWGGGMIAMKYAFESFTAMQVVFARVAFAGVIYLALYRLWSHIPYQKGDWKYLLAMVLFEPCLFFLCETFAMTYTTASQGGVIAACFPLCTAVAAWLFLGEKLTKKTIIAMLLAVAGVAGASPPKARIRRPTPSSATCLWSGPSCPRRATPCACASFPGATPS